MGPQASSPLLKFTEVPGAATAAITMLWAPGVPKRLADFPSGRLQLTRAFCTGAQPAPPPTPPGSHQPRQVTWPPPSLRSAPLPSVRLTLPRGHGLLECEAEEGAGGPRMDWTSHWGGGCGQGPALGKGLSPTLGLPRPCPPLRSPLPPQQLTPMATPQRPGRDAPAR